jgi:hypothetical protein
MNGELIAIALRDALHHLGYAPFHFSEMMLHYREQIPLWTEALEAAHFGKAKPYGRKEFDKLLGDYDVRQTVVWRVNMRTDPR